MKKLILIIALFNALMAAAVDVPWPDREVWPQSPQARQIAQVMMPTPALLTGACEYSVPLYTIEAEGVSIPLSLQYRSNGIRVDDDPQPIGYGWTLTPPVRVIRQIMGRPDEWFPFKGEESGFDDYVKAYRSITQYDALTIAGIDSVNRYDTERDFFTIYLPDVSLTVVRIDGQFVGAHCDEYKIEGDTRLTYIKVTDPRGIVYNFNIEGENMGETVLRTEWLLGQIVLPSGRSIDFTWIRNNHYAHGMSGFAGTFMRYNNEAPFSYCPEPTVGNYGKLASYCNTHDLKAIDFPGGKVSFEYSPEEDLIRMLQRVVVTSGNKTVFTARLLRSYTDLQRHLLGGLEVEGVGTYSFSYNPITFNTNNTCDWWGFYNGIASDDYIRSPGFTLKVGGESRFASTENLRGSDRSVDTVMMQANILERVVAPTGGIITWEYEPHHFPEQRSTAAWVTDRMDEQALSYGGGLRVKRITLANGASDTTPRVRTYRYGQNQNGLAQIVAAPLLHTFINETQLYELRLTGPGAFEYLDYYMSINPYSNYLEGQIGVVPIWYDQVTEYDAEGKTEYRFQTFLDSNIVEREWGRVHPRMINTAFSKGPQLVSKSVYKNADSGYSLVEQTTNHYTVAHKSHFSFLNTLIYRKIAILDYTNFPPDFGESPDYAQCFFIDFENMQHPNVFHPDGTNIPKQLWRNEHDWFGSKQYRVAIQTEQLASRTTKTFCDNGVITRTERFTYRPGTNLLSRKVECNGTDSVTTVYGYENSQGPEPNAAMLEANAVGIPTEVKTDYHGAISGYGMQMTAVGSAVFRPIHIWEKRGSDSWTYTQYGYNSYGCITSATGVFDHVARAWTWDSSGRYPLSNSIAGHTIGTATWQPLVGVKTLVDGAGVTQSFDYDNYGRLVAASVANRLTQQWNYRINQDGDNRITTAQMLSANTSAASIARYDALGRQWATLAQLPTGYAASIVEFDAMGRQYRQWMPAVTSSVDASASEIQSSATDIGGSYPFVQTTFEASQRNLPLSATKAGSAWQSHPLSSTILTNDNGTYACPKYVITTDGVEQQGTYQPGSLVVQAECDEDGLTTTTFTDIRGLVVCRRQADLTTSYVYNNFGDLCYVLPPGVNGSHSRSDNVMQKCAYWYDYDNRGRLISKHIPGAGEHRFLYDPAGRIAAEQTINHPDGAWRFYGYDNSGRQVVAFDVTLGDNEAEDWAAVCHTATLNVSGEQEYDRGGYSFSPAWELPCKIVWAKYFDNYQFLTIRNLGEEFNFDFNNTLQHAEYDDLIEFDTHLTAPVGYLTGIFTGKGHEVYYYDKYGRQAQSFSTGFNVGRCTNTYTYSGQPKAVVYDFSETSGDMLDMSMRYSYDAVGRPTQVAIGQQRRMAGFFAAPAANGSISLACDSTWVSTHYDAVGRVRGIGSGRNTFTDIAYDVHGWQTSRVYHTSAGNFNELLLYANGAYPRYNGNISSKISNNYRYDYRYDEYNRLIAANYHGIGSSGQDFSTAYSYDQRGNITHLQRKGVVMRLPSGAEQFGVLDNVSTQYAGNQLVALVNPAQGGNFEGRTGVGVMPAQEITYDFAGRILSDESRGIDRIYYDNDGHPVRIDFTAGHRHLLTYDGLGRLMSVAYFQQVSSAAGTGTATHLQRTCVRRYTGAGHVIDNDSVRMTRFPGGYLDRGGNAFYYLTDYQGNNIAVVDAGGSITQRSYYYPYGEPWRYPDGQQYLFSDKELTRADGRHVYAFPARTLLPNLPRWTTPDPLAEQTPWDSPYAYCAANPIANIDPTGLIVIADEWCQQGIIDGLSEEDRLLISFNESGVLNNQLINSASSNSLLLGILKELSNSETDYNLVSANHYYDSGKDVLLGADNPDGGYNGITIMPSIYTGGDNSNNVDIFIFDQLAPNERVSTIAHELYGHAYFFELNKSIHILYPYHTYMNKGYNTYYDDELQATVFEGIKVPTNIVLETWINHVVSIVQTNYLNKLNKYNHGKYY